MAFETFLTVDKARPRKGRRLTLAISLGVHAVLLLVGVVSSFASVDELKPPPGTHITFTELPAPPPPAAGAKTNTTKQHTRTHTKALHQPTEIRAPQATRDEPPSTEPPGDDPNAHGDQPCDGCVGNTSKFQDGGFLPPSVTAWRRITDPQDDRYRPHLPPALTHSGMTVSVLMKLCTDRDGNVINVKIMRSSDPAAVDAVATAARTWRYTPYMVEGRAVPFCTTVNFQVRTN